MLFQSDGAHGFDAPLSARVTAKPAFRRITPLREANGGEARVTGYHQVGYYAIHVKEKRERRLELAIFRRYPHGLVGCMR
jgi:hypothetical protein